MLHAAESSCLRELHDEILLLGGSGVVISGVISPLIRVISIVTLVVTLLITTHEPPSRLRKMNTSLPGKRPGTFATSVALCWLDQTTKQWRPLHVRLGTLNPKP